MRKAFTTVELVITLALIGILAAMSAVTISTMISIQGNAGQTASTAEQVDKASRKIGEVVSFVSIENDACDFAVSASNESNITFINNADLAQYSLSFAGNKLEFATTYAGSDAYLKYSFVEQYSEIKSIIFSYDAALALLKVSFAPSSGAGITHMYSLEVLR